MITIPASLIDREDLNLMERSLIPLIARHTQQWGDKPGDIDASTLAQALRHSPREVVEALDAMVKKGLLKTVRRKTDQGVMIRYTFAPVETITAVAVSVSASQYSDSNYYLNLSNDAHAELHAFALELCDREGLRQDIFEDFNLYQRSQNRRSFDWCAEFERWVRKEISANVPVVASEQALAESKPTTEEFEMAQYFIRHLSSIDPQFEEPFDVISWAKQIRLLIDTGGYSLLDIKSAIDWLFSAKGDWFRPNVPDAYHLRKHFKRLIAHTRSFRDGKPRLPDGVDLFDLYEQM
jgi:DNA-binding MarR family transcriptional regulator